MTKSLRAWFLEFTEISQIHGCSFISVSKPHSIRFSFWTSTLLALVIICIFHAINLYLYFNVAPTAITIATSSTSPNFNFPSAAACVEINFTFYLEQTLRGVNEETLMAILANLTQSGQLALLKSRSPDAVLSSALLNLTSASALHPTFVAVSYSLISLMMDYDRHERSSIIALNASVPHVLPLIDLVQSYIENASIDFRFLAKIVGTYMCRAMQLGFYSNVNRNTPQPQCATLNSVVWLGAAGFVPGAHVLCASFLPYTFFANEYVLLTLTGMPQLLYGANIAPSGVSELNLYFDPYGGQSARDTSKFDVLSGAAVGSLTSGGGISAFGAFVWLNRTGAPCGEIDQFSCAEQKLYAQILANRSCTSLMEFGASLQAPPCTARYTIGSDNNATAPEEMWQWILGSCPSQCAYTRFTSTMYPAGSGVNNQTFVFVNPEPVLFLTFTEYYLMDFQAFLNAFGGLIGWWLGASIIAIVHAIVFVTKALSARFFPSNQAIMKHFPENTAIKAFREYCTATMFHGFPILAQETNIVATVVWLLLLPLCIGLTFQQSAVLISTYNAEPIETSASIQSNSTTLFDDAAHCLGINRNTLFARNQSATVVEFNRTLQRFIVSGQMGVLRSLLQQGAVSSENLSALDERVMLMAHMMTTAFTDFDQGASWNTVAAYSELIFDQVDILKRVLQLNDVDFFQLAKLNAAYLCDVIYRFQVVLNRFDAAESTFESTVFNPCLDLTKYVWSTGNPMCTSFAYCNIVDILCVRLPTSATVFSMPQDFISVIAASDASINFMAFDLMHGLGNFDPQNYDADFGIVSSPGSIGSEETISAVLLHESRDYNRSASPCSATTQTDCALHCFFRKVSAERNCWSLADLSVAEKPAQTAPCLQHYNFDAALEEMAPNSTYQSLTLSDCAANACFPPCTSRLWLYYAQSIVTLTKNVLQLNIHQNAFVYIVYESSPLMDMTSLLSALGGIIGLWIGGSVIAMIHIPVFIFSALCRYIYKPKNPKLRVTYIL